jgi:hypothetical protein
MSLAAVRRMLRTSRLSWLLVLALWLPVAQWTAAMHVLVHLQEADNGHDGGHDGLAACDVAAASLHAAAPPPPLPAAPPADSPRARYQALAPGIGPAHSPLPYRSRAPPLPHA